MRQKRAFFFPHQDPSQKHYPLRNANKARGTFFFFCSLIMEILGIQHPEVRLSPSCSHPFLSLADTPPGVWSIGQLVPPTHPMQHKFLQLMFLLKSHFRNDKEVNVNGCLVKHLFRLDAWHSYLILIFILQGLFLWLSFFENNGAVDIWSRKHGEFKTFGAMNLLCTLY